jgi:hypothetical protein
VGERRRALASPNYKLPLSPKKAVDVMISSVELSPAPKRLALGSGAYNLMHMGLSERLATLESQREMAFAADYDE